MSFIKMGGTETESTTNCYCEFVSQFTINDIFEATVMFNTENVIAK
jgi:hypothetical protein